MKLLEHQAKQLLADHALPVPESVLITDSSQAVSAVQSLDAPFWMVKAQVRAGERADHGGVVRASNAAAVVAVADTLIGSRLVTPQTRRDGERVDSVLIEAGCPAVRELYLGMLVDSRAGELVALASPVGGSVMREVDLAERLASDEADIVRVRLSSSRTPDTALCAHIASELGISDAARASFDHIITGLHGILIDYDAMLVEVNPLAELANGEFVCLDCKISLDSNAQHRIPALPDAQFDNTADGDQTRAVAGYNYRSLDGDVGCVVTGAALALATMDMLCDAKLEPANFMDLPPGARQATVESAIRHLITTADPAMILVNAISGGFTHLESIAAALCACADTIGARPVVVRFAGEGKEVAWRNVEGSPLVAERAETMADALAAASQLRAQ